MSALSARGVADQALALRTPADNGVAYAFLLGYFEAAARAALEGSLAANDLLRVALEASELVSARIQSEARAA